MQGIDDVVAALDADGFAIVEHLLTIDRAREIRDELRRLLEPVPGGRNDFEGFTTRRLYALYAKTRVLDDLTLHPLVLEALQRMLGPHFQRAAPRRCADASTHRSSATWTAATPTGCSGRVLGPGARAGCSGRVLGPGPLPD